MAWLQERNRAFMLKESVWLLCLKPDGAKMRTQMTCSLLIHIARSKQCPLFAQSWSLILPSTLCQKRTLYLIIYESDTVQRAMPLKNQCRRSKNIINIYVTLDGTGLSGSDKLCRHNTIPAVNEITTDTSMKK